MLIAFLAFISEIFMKKNNAAKEVKQRKMYDDSEFFSTSAIAAHNEIEREKLFMYLLQHKYIFKENGYKLTEKGFRCGAQYKSKNENETWIVWPANSLNNIMPYVKKFQYKKPTKKKKTYRNFNKQAYPTNAVKDINYESNDWIEFYNQDKDSNGWR